MGDNENKDKQAKKQAPAWWVTIVTAILSLTSALLVAITSNAQLELQREVESLNASIREAEVALEQRRFEAEQQVRRDEIVMKYVPQLLSSNESDNDAATAVLFLLYPNEAKDMLRMMAESLLDEESAATLEQRRAKAVILDKKVGDWAIAIGSDTKLISAQDKVRRAEEQGYAPVIYLRGGLYVTTVGPFSTQTEAESVNITVRSTIWESALVINLNSWCPQPEQKTEAGIDYFECPPDTPTPSAPPGMVYVPAGEFIMGSTDADVDSALALCKEYHIDCERSWFENEQPQHTMYLDAFDIDETEVTNAQFAAFISATGYETDAEQTGCGWIFDGDDWDCTQGVDWQHPFGPDTDLAGKDEHPVVQVSWNDAKAYCEWAGARLPTEAEWEKAARGTDGRVYPWGNTFDGTKLNFADKNASLDWSDSNWNDGYADTAPVGSYPDGASPYGALDMAGNVWEWVADWYNSGYYSQSPRRNPPGPDFGESRVRRGGSWHYGREGARCASRYWHVPVNGDNNLGFRCARDSE